MKFVFPYNNRYYLYKITNDINNKIYIGRSKKPDYRLRTHLNNSLNPEKSIVAQKIHFAIRELGQEHFVFEVFEEYDNYREACEREVFWIKFYKADQDEFGYNDKLGTTGLVRLTEEQRQKLSARVSGNKNPMYGKTHSEGVRKQLSAQFSGEKNPFYGKTHSEETKKLIGASSKDRNAGENNPHAKLNLEIVSQIRDEWQTGNYKKVELSKKYNVTPQTINNIISGRTWK